MNLNLHFIPSLIVLFSISKILNFRSLKIFAILSSSFEFNGRHNTNDRSATLYQVLKLFR